MASNRGVVYLGRVRKAFLVHVANQDDRRAEDLRGGRRGEPHRPRTAT
jgi:hypothetical protein